LVGRSIRPHQGLPRGQTARYFHSSPVDDAGDGYRFEYRDDANR
jgi:hypothetical protein